jgi:hypothetical protein
LDFLEFPNGEVPQIFEPNCLKMIQVAVLEEDAGIVEKGASSLAFRAIISIAKPLVS